MPVITIARGSFGVAAALAERLAGALGWRVLSREDVYEAAKAYGIEETGLGDMEFVDQRPPSLWVPVYGRRQRYLACFQAALMDAAMAGDLVYVGHLAHLLLSTYRRVLRVRLAAPERYRVEMLARQRGWDKSRAAAYIREIDERRLRWSEFLYGVDWRDPELYDVVLNPERLRLETMADAIGAIARSDDMQATAFDREQLANQRLGAVARVALLRSPRTRGLDVTLEADARRGRLHVYGVASSMSAEVVERDLRKLLTEIPGVTRVEISLGDDPFR
jgi:Cytidylate kinase-like family